MPQNAIVYCMKVLPCPVCTVHSLFEISDVKMFVERDSILFSCCFFRFVSFFLAQVEFGALFGQFIMVGYGRKLGAFTRHVRQQGQRTWLVVLPPKLCPRARSSS